MGDLTTGTPLWEKRYLFEIEPAKAIHGLSWTQHGIYTNCYWISHSEGEPSKVEDWVTEKLLYVENTVGLADLDANAGQWWWDSANRYLYVHASQGGSPGSGLYLMLSYFWDRHADSPVVIAGHDYRPDVDRNSIPAIKMSVGGFHEGMAQHSFGEIRFNNADAWWDTRFSNYIYEAKKVLLRVGDIGETDSDSYKIFWNGWIGDIKWTDVEVSLNIEDLRVCVT